MFEPEDIQIYSYQPATLNGTYSIRITHTPTNTTTSLHQDKSYFKAKKAAEQELASLLYQTADAPCNFCNKSMPCSCEPPEDIDERVDEMIDAWVEYSDLLDER